MKVIKFGGSSLKDQSTIEKAIEIIRQNAAEDRQLCVVVSAMGGVTDEILHIASTAAKQDPAYRERRASVHQRHITTLNAVAGDDEDAARVIDELCVEFFGICDGVYALGELSLKVLDRLMSFGELCSANMIAATCRKNGLAAQFADSRDLIVTDEHFGAARVDFERTNERLRRLPLTDGTVAIFPGFVARSVSGRVTTLGRNGSDYSAAIIGAGLGAASVEIWTDVDGVLTANPRYVPSASAISEMSYIEAMELSHFGAYVLHSPTLQPVMEKKIPLRVCNTFNPQFAGTIIRDTSVAERVITGISTIDDVAFIRVQGSGMVGVFGVAGRLFSSLANARVNLIMISQGSSEHSICFAVQSSDADRALDAVLMEFEPEITAHMMEKPVVEKDMCVLAVVGENMRRQPGIAGRVFGALGTGGFNVVSIAQGSSELNISMVLRQQDAKGALNAIHGAFF
jgi:bifunctional aspartokinase / homoserine dehydrogenase 1